MPAPSLESAHANKVRLWPLALVSLVIGVWIGWLWLVADLTRANRNIGTGKAMGVGILLTLVWLLAFSRLRWRARLAGVLAFTVFIGLLFALLRMEHVDGDMVPQFVWRWTPKPHLALAGKELTDEKTPAATDALGEDLQTISKRDYPGFLGPHRNGTLDDVRLQRDWTAHPPERLWRQPIGAGWSSFAIVGDCAVTQEQRGDQEMVVCYKLLTGKTCWTHADPAYYESKITGDGPRATPTIEAGRVYSLGATGILNCLDGATGKPVWPARNVLADAQAENARWGKSCSPLVIDNLVVVTGGSHAGASLLAYDKLTGELVWKSLDDSKRWQAYASPMVATLLGQRQILTMNDNTVAGHDPADGRLLWSRNWPGAEPKVTQPIPLNESQLFVASGYGVGCVRWELYVDSENRIQVHELWHTRNLKPKFTGAVRHGEFVYGLDDGILVCIDLANGKRKWKEGRYYNGQIMLIGDLILVQAEDGHIVLVEANPVEHVEVARFPALVGVTWNHPAFAPPYLLVRNDSGSRLLQAAASAVGRAPDSLQVGALLPDGQEWPSYIFHADGFRCRGMV